MKFFWQKNEGVKLDDGNFVGPKSSLYLSCCSRKRTVSVSFISFEKYELRMRKNFCPHFRPKTPSMKKHFDVIFGQNVAYETILYNLRNHVFDPAQLLAKTWCRYLFWVFRNLPHKFEKLAHVTQSAKKKRHHMGIWQNSAPKI